MARQSIDIGVQGNDGTGDSIRESFRKVNENFVQLFAVFGQGDTISFTDLDDTPETYGSDQVIVSNTDGDALVAKNLVGGEGIAVDHSDENEIRIISTGGKLANDVAPNLGGHLNAQNFSIGNLAEPTDETAALFNDLHDTSITADQLVITRGYADQRYLQASGGPGTGSQIRVRDEPVDSNEYTIAISNWTSGYALIPAHGFNSGSNGISYKYYITGTVPATGLTISPVTTYYLHYIDKDRMSVHPTREDAIAGTNRIFVNIDPEINSILRGIETFVDASYDPTLEGNWVSNEALPRKSVVRRQGDTMDGTLMLSDHPGTLAGAGSPNGADDLQAATKYYVDNSSFASAVNLFVAMNGDDLQEFTPAGKEGRAFAYAFATLNAACRKAEQLVIDSLSEPGPYRQALMYGNYTNPAYLYSFSTGIGARRTLNVFSNGVGVDQSKDVNNRDLREGSIIKGLYSGATGKVITYSPPSGLNDSYVIELLHANTDITTFQSDHVRASAKLLNNKAFIAAEIVEYIKAKYPSLVFNETKCNRDAGLIVDAIAFDIKYGGNKQSIVAGRAYWNGVVSVLPLDQRSQTIDGINYINLLAQDIIDNVVISAAVGIGYGRRTSAIDYPQYSSGEAGESGSDTSIARLVESIVNIVENGEYGDGTYSEFITGEPLEFGQLIPELHITIRVESGIYYEQLPIRVPTNVSIRGDEFRRTIIRPAPGVSTSPWASLYFYRDSTFDGLTRTYVGTAASSSYIAPGVDPLNEAGYYKVTLADTTGVEVGMYLYVTSGTGIFAPTTQVTRIISTTEFEINEQPIITLSGATVRGLNSSGLAPEGSNFGYHYLTDPTGVSGIFDDTITKTSGNTNAAALLAAAKSSIQSGVISYINSTYPELDYNETLCSRDVGYIVDAITNDLILGGVHRTIAAGEAYYRNTSSVIAITTQLTETLDGIDRINTLAQAILTDPSAESNTDLIVADLIDGIKNIIIRTNNPPKANKDMDMFLMNDGTIIRNITGQGHGGFMMVLDPEGQIQTKSPYCQTATSLSRSTNSRRFSGGMFVDGFSGNLPARIAGKNSNTELILDGLIVRAPLVPNSFYIAGVRYQLNAVEDYDRSAGTCRILLDESTPYTAAFSSPIDIIIETAGNRSMLSNDYTQVNDLGYGLVTTNNGISEAVSLFTYYNWVSYFANNGGQIRSVSGSSCNGVYGLKSSGSDPNEVPDPVVLGDTMVQSAKVYKRDAFASKNVADDQSIYVDFYSYASGTTEPAIYNVSEIEIDHSNTKSSLVTNTPTLPNNVTIANAGTGYNVNEFVQVDGGTLYSGGNKTRIKIIAVNGLGAVTDFEVVDAGLYSVNPVGGYPTVYGASITTTAESGGGTNFRIAGTYLGDFSRYEVSNLETTSSYGVGMDSLGGIVYSPGSFVIGQSYIITSLGGSPNFTAIGASANAIGVVFTAIGSGTGSGTASISRRVLKLNLNSSSGSGLLAPLEDEQIIVIRGLQNFRFTGVERVRPVRPSTALEFTSSSEAGSVYRTLAYNLSYPTGASLLSSKSISFVARVGSTATVTTSTNHGLSSGDYVTVVCTSNSSFDATAVPVTVTGVQTFTYLSSGTTLTTTAATGTVTFGNQAVLTFDNSYDHTIVQTEPSNISAGYGLSVGDTKIAVAALTSTSTIAKLNSGTTVFCWAGAMHRITGYVVSPVPHITFVDIATGSGSIVSGSGLRQGFNIVTSVTLRSSLQAGEQAEITVNISTCRATGHDFLDVGSGGYNNTNYPNNLLGAPAQTPSRSNEVIEETQGRVFYVSTDQFGIFRVGKFFTVDQGTGSVTFAASIALSNLDGLGFKKGTVVKEFSTDNTMTDNADDAVPVESAVRGYIDKRLGVTHTGATVALSDRIPALTGGFLPVSGSPTLESDLSMGSVTPHRITNLTYNPASSTDASTIGYVNTQVGLRDSFYKLKEVNVMTPAAGDLVAFTGAGKSVISTTIEGDIGVTLTSVATSTLVGGRSTPGSTDTGILDATGVSVAYGIEIADASTFPDPGGSYTAYIQIGTEILSYTEITGNILENITRSNFTTIAAAHSSGAGVMSLDLSRLNLQIQAGAIDNNDISATAAIAQSKLAMNAATTRANATGITQADRGLASFDSANFVVTDGWVGIKAGGIALGEIQDIAAGSILGNLTGSAAAPQEVTTSGIVQNGINSLFTTIDAGSNVLTRRVNSLKGATTFTNLVGTPIAGSGTLTNIPVSNISGTGNGALVTVAFSGGSYTGVAVTYGGNGYAEGDELYIPGTLLGGASPANDYSFTVQVTGSNIDTEVYLGIERVSAIGEINSIVKTDYLGNLGNVANKFNNIYSTTFTGALSGNAATATTATNLAGTDIGGIPYQSASNTTTILAAGTSGRYLKTQGPGNPPTWSELVIPDGSAENLTGTFINSGVTGSSLVTFGDLTRRSVSDAVAAAGTTQAGATLLTKEINIISTGSGGVKLPVALAGYRIIIRNNLGATINVYPNTGAQIANNGANAAVTLDPDAALEYFATSATQWYNLNATFA
jgi:hypothetical protein